MSSGQEENKDEKEPKGNGGKGENGGEKGNKGEESSGKKEGEKDEKKGGDEKKEDGKGDKQNDPKRKKKRVLWLTIFAAVLVVVGVAGYLYVTLYASKHQGTDDAYVAGHTHQIGSRVAGTVREVLVDDNYHVKAGQPLVRLDPRDYQVSLQRAQAQLDQAKAQLAQADAAVSQANADVLQRQAQVAQAEAQVLQSGAQFEIARINYDRNSSLFQKDLRAVSKQDVDTTRANFDAARGAYDASKATLDASKATLESSKANLQSAHAQRETSQANVEINDASVADAKLQLSYCEIIAPVDGFIARKSVEAGNRLSVGQQLMAVVEDDVWILANLKETQLEYLKVGQPVSIKIDALPHEKFTGRVDSLQPGTGSNFALLPPDNATGNFIKIVQRVPVKIIFDPDSIRDYRDKIVPGLSTEPTIDISGKNAVNPGPTPILQGSEKPALGVVQ